MAEPPRRTHPRLKDFDYSQSGAYFLTVCTREKQPLFGSVGRDDLGAPCTNLSNLGAIVERYIRSIPDAYSNVVLEKYVVMPNHIHLLLRVTGPAGGAPGSSRPTQLVPRMIAALKRFINREAGRQLWQSSYYDHVIRNEEDFLRTWAYMDENPAKWAEDAYHR